MSSLIPGYNYDIFISYRQKDNKYDGWVTEFVDNLKRELESMFKEEVSVYFDINPHDGLLETHDVDESLKTKLKCLICILIISRTYCDPKSFAWEHEFKAFVELASNDKYGLKVKLTGGNVANRVLPVRIHDLDIADIKLFENQIEGVLRSIDFVYKETGVNRQLRAKDDDVIKNPNQILYRDQINKVALAIKNIIESLKIPDATELNERTFSQVIGKTEREDLVGKDLELIEEGGQKKFFENDGKKAGIEKKFFIFPFKMKILVPTSLIILLVVIAGLFLLNHFTKIKWARQEALPEIENLYNQLNTIEAFSLAQKAKKYIPEDLKLKNWLSRVTSKITILTEPSGANVYIKEYSDIDGAWEKIGTTPIDSLKMPWFTFYQVKLEKAGYDTVLAVTTTSLDTLFRKLFNQGKIPQGMVYVEGYWDEVNNVFLKDKGFFIDKYEVTNKQYKEFVDKGGYSNKAYWNNIFIKNSKTLTWEEAMSEFTDKTGRPGPSTWEASDYPDGEDDYPVSGISWYEAAAYAEFAGKELPTADHWDSAAGFYWSSVFDYIGSRIYPMSNFNGKGTELVGKNHGMTVFGAFDMAGNVREWNRNETEIGRIISGAGYDDSNYLFRSWSQLPPFDRSPQNGFRCVMYLDRNKIPESAFRKINLGEGRDFSKEVPVSEEIFKIYKNQFLYDKLPLNPALKERDESAEDWIVEKIEFDAAYDGERMLAYLCLPKNANPPYSTVIFFPGIYAFTEKEFNYRRYTSSMFDFILKSGRAVMFPIYSGTYERKEGQPPMRLSHQYSEWLTKSVKDFSRSIDYLDTRTDIDKTSYAFFGHSMGGRLGGIIPAVENRLSASILIVGGFSGKAFPEAEEINYVSRVKIPTLMLNGRFDNQFPYETAVIPFFNLLGTPEKDKKIIVYETDHYVPRSEMIRETLNWFDKYLRPVNHLSEK